MKKKNKSFAAQMQQRKNHQRYFKTALVWFVMMTVMRSSSLLSLTPASPNSSRLEPLFSNSVNWEFLHNVFFWLFVGAPQLYYQALSHPLKSHRRVGGCVWTEGHIHISGFKSILNVKSAQFSVTKEIIDTSHSDRLNSHSCYLLLPQFTKWL